MRSTAHCFTLPPTGLALPCALLVLLLGSACSQRQALPGDTAAKQAAYQQRVEHLGNGDHWTLNARLAIDDGEDGGSGTFSWSRAADQQSMSFYGAMGRGAWRLQAGDGGAELTRSDGTIHRADSIDQLVEQQLGYPLPVEYLTWWVKGLAAPGAVERLELDETGAPDLLHQQSWVIRFERYRAFDGIQMPVKITARQGAWTVKLAVRSWRWGEA